MKLKTSKAKEAAKDYHIIERPKGRFKSYDNKVLITEHATYEAAQQALLYRLMPLLRLEED